MRTSASGRPHGQKRGKTLSPFGHHAPDLLAIPKLAKSIPGVFETDQFATRWAKIALLWLDAGYLEESDKGSPRELILTAVARWMDKLVEGNRQLANIAVSVMPYPTDDGFSPGAHLGYEQDNWKDKWFIGFIGGFEMPWVVLERRITELEQAHPGLGRTAAHWFEMASSQLLPIFTPHTGRYMAERVWWYGMDNQEDYIAERDGYCEESEEEEDESEEDDSFGPDGFDAQFPAWMFKPVPGEWPLLDQEQLKDLALNGTTEQARKVAEIVLALSQRDHSTYRLPYVYGDSPVQMDNAYHLAYVRWSRDDCLVQLVDDLMNDANQCSDCYTELLGADCVPLDPSGFQQWKLGIEAGFAVLKELDALLPLISDPD